MDSDPIHRLFVAVPLPSGLEAALAPWLDTLRGIRGLRPVPVPNLHLTAFFIGNVSAQRTEPFMQQVDTIAGQVSSFRLEPQAFVFRGKPARPSMIWLEFFQSDGFRSLHARLREAFEPYQSVRNPFPEPVPHITLARIRGGIDLRAEVRFPATVPDGFEVDRIGLWRTLDTPDGVRYERLSESAFRG